MTPQERGAIVIYAMNIVIAIIGGLLFWNVWKHPCTACEVIEQGEKCWNCGKVKTEAP